MTIVSMSYYDKFVTKQYSIQKIITKRITKVITQHSKTTKGHVLMKYVFLGAVHMEIIFLLFSRLTQKIDIVSSPSCVNYFPGWVRLIFVGC